ncbi:MAG TPA: prepilin peptidase [Pyrinomonadaceae bacterium]|jgi:leader peptidase (prepilin peptidase)/N-methyltransferase|nr:prepilin peptidase [Pyrinomonadaceae bacterium]
MFAFSSFEAVTGLPDIFGLVFALALGAIVGSFLNVVIHRVPNDLSIVFPSSTCPKCQSPIKPYDNIPVLSWMVLGGKCRNCKASISARYPAVELLTGVIFALVTWQIGFNVFLPIALIFAAVMVSLIFIDAGHMILPNVITYPLFVFALLVRLIYPIAFGPGYFSDMNYAPATWMAGYPEWAISVACGLAGALAGGGSLWLVGEVWKRLRGVEAMGLGDVKMMLGVGMLLGWRLTLLSIFLGAFSGAVIGILMIAKQKDRNMQAQIPFGIFLGTGSLLALLFGEPLIAWYASRFL